MKTTERNKTIFILDTFTNEVLSQMTIKEGDVVPFSFQCEFEMLKEKLGTVVVKQWIEGHIKATTILR